MQTSLSDRELIDTSFRIFERRAGQGIQQPDEKIAFPK